MRINDGRWRTISSDLGLNDPIIKGQKIPVRNCWHFSTDGNAVDALFMDDEDFRYGMNLIYLLTRDYSVIILAFSLMDTHVHFVLYGDFDECNKMMHEYLRRLSIYISHRHGDHKKLLNCPLSHQSVEDNFYLKTVICYTIKNAPVGGLSYSAIDYPWSSGPLYFRVNSGWSRPVWCDSQVLTTLSGRRLRDITHSHKDNSMDVIMIDDVIFPGEYVAYELVEKIFRSHRGFNYFMCISKDSDVESRGGIISNLTIPIQEMRQHKNELCQHLYGVSSIKTLDTSQRLRLVRTLKSRYNSSPKQICKLCGLIYDDVVNLL